MNAKFDKEFQKIAKVKNLTIFYANFRDERKYGKEKIEEKFELFFTIFDAILGILFNPGAKFGK